MKCTLTVHLVLMEMKGEEPTLVKCHRNYLAKTSPYFSSMFYGDMKRQSNEVIRLPDVNLEAFIAMLKYVYLGKLDLHKYSYEVVCGLLHLAKMYLLPKIFRQQIRNYLWENVYPNNVWTAVEFGKSNYEAKLERTAWQMIERNTKSVLELPSFEDISGSMLLDLVKKEYLDCTEIELFNACLHWAKIEAIRLRHDPEPLTLREILAEIIPHIRFLAIEKQQFANKVVESHLFTSEECLPLLMYHITERLKNLSPIFCTNSEDRDSMKQTEYFEVVGHHTSVGLGKNTNIRVGETFITDTTSSVLARGSVRFEKSVCFFGVQVPSQVKNEFLPANTYEEYLTLIVRSDHTMKIISVTHFKAEVNYNTIIDVPLDKPLRCNEYFHNDAISCFVVFHKTGKYPALRDTEEECIREAGRFNLLAKVWLHYRSSFKYFHSFASSR